DDEITATMDETRRKLLENFDAEVHDRLRVSLAESTEFIDKADEQLWRITTHVLDGLAAIDHQARTFDLPKAPSFAPDVEAGRYHLARTEGEHAHRYRRRHP